MSNNHTHTSDSFRKTVLRYSITGIVSAGIIISLIIAVPFSVRLQKEQDSRLVHQVQVKSMIVEELLSRATDTALQITSRTQIRKKLEAYNRKEIDLATLAAFSEPKLADAMRLSEHVAGIIRLDKTNNLTAQAGQPIPGDLWSIPDKSSQEVLIRGPVNISGASYIALAAPILGQNLQRVGTDIILYKAARLQQIVEDTKGLGETGETIIGKIENDQINLFYPLRAQREKSSVAPFDSAEKKNLFLAASKYQDGLFVYDNPGGADSVIGFEPVHNGRWCLFIKIDKYELYDSVYQLVIVMGVTVVLLILFGASGMHRVLRPMVGKVLIHTDDLEAKIEEQTTELQDAYNQLKSIQGELSQRHKMEAIGTMAGGIAHNFNNNLAIILGNLELAELNRTQPVKIERYLANAKIAVMRARDLISQISTYSRKEMPALVPLKLHQILDETMNLLRSTIPSTITMTQTVRVDSDHVIFADATQIQEALLNLCNNAVQAMNEKGQLSLSLESADLKQQDILSRYNCRPGQYLRLSVQDNGCGIEAEIQEKIFDPFFTTKEINKGTGMGLSTVMGIMQKVNGMIAVESAAGKGSTFSLYFPVAKHKQKPLSSDDSHAAAEISRQRLARR